ncbi:hypothetical protein L9F63_008909 [Diploptera punctata]|uniref:Non-structural maintenance of chromosomes element 1 homolog n=1 Tax=Diploptera punctata TaxID=6984 RepID=A0AAD7Z4F1_DIPPU|nr:hypothetical protein L9F63_008909 [Diploptera punctata]
MSLTLPPQYSDVHRGFLQILMNRRMISKTVALRIFHKIHDSYTGIEVLRDDDYCKGMENAVLLINKVIKRFNQEIRSAEDELSCEMFYLFIFTIECPFTRQLNRYSADELEYFKGILHEVVTSDDGYVSSTACLNLNITMSKPITKTDTETLIEKFCKDLWLIQKNGKITLSLLSIVELEPILISHYEEYINKCHLCKRIALQGFRCENCLSLLHLACIRRYTKKQTEPVCPKCGQDQPCMISGLSNLHISNTNDDSEEISEEEEQPAPSRSSKKRKIK